MKKEAFNWSALLSARRLRPPYRAGVETPETAIENDYQRIVSSASFRRLQDKTQVFPLDESDFVRTRLTHSLEVSALARSLGLTVVQALYFRGMAEDLSAARVSEICDVLLCAGLIHDIGNPPFGHYGETTIRDWFKRQMPCLTFHGQALSEVLTERMQADFFHFEGNAQALRLLSKLHFLVDDKGMNLTLSLLNTIIKNPQPSTQVDENHSNPRFQKMGYFLAEESLYTAISEETGCRGQIHPLSLILEAADDICYRTADIEDAYRKSRFTYDQLLEALHSNVRQEAAAPALRLRLGRQIEALRNSRETALREKPGHAEQYAISNWVVHLKQEMMLDCADAFATHYEEIMRGDFSGSLVDATAAGLMLAVLGDIAYDFVFSSKAIVQMEIAANTIVGGLLDKFVPASIYWDTETKQSSLEPRLMAIISDNYKACYQRHALGKSEQEKLYLRLLLVTDYICGMTDRFAQSLYRQMNGV